MHRWIMYLKFKYQERVLAKHPMYGHGAVVGFLHQEDKGFSYVVEMEGGILQFVKEKDLMPEKTIKLVSSKY